MSKLGIGTDPGEKVTLSYGDLDLRNMHCPQCNVYGTISKVGELHANGATHDAYHCSSCNALFTGARGGVAALVDKVAEALGVAPNSVGFTISNSTTGTASQNSGYPSGFQSETNVQSVINSLNQVSMNTSNLYQIQSIFSELSKLNDTIEDLVNQNKQLMKKLSTDPLVNIRKKVSAFNLE